MARFAWVVIGLSLAAPAGAEEIGAEQATEMLKRAEVADSRCHFLTSSLHDELSRYAAKAEIAAASQTSTNAAQIAATAGKVEGNKAPCDEATRMEVGQLLRAAREAINAGATGQRVARFTPGAAAVKPKAVAAAAKVAGLGDYGEQVKAYYVERKCRHLSALQDNRYWQAITRIYQATVAQNGVGWVARTQARAEAEANRLHCGGDTLLIVKQGFADAVGR
jgi:hypothetical protein